MDDSFNTDLSSARQRAISPNLRFSVLERDGFKCCYCGATPDRAELRVDHIYPVAKGGTDHLDNLITACDPCNAGKSDRVMVPELVQAMQAKARERNKIVHARASRVRKKPVVIRGVEYESGAAAAMALGVDPAYIRKARRLGNLDGIGLRAKGHNRDDCPITVRGVTYANASAVAVAFRIKKHSVLDMVSRGRADSIGLGGAQRPIECVIDGVEYPSVGAATKALGLTYQQAYRLACATKRISPDYSFDIDGVRYDSITDAARRLGVSIETAGKAKAAGTLAYPRKKLGREITVRGVTYPSLKACAEALGIHQTTLNQAIIAGKLERVGLGIDQSRKIDPFGNKLPTGIFWDRRRERYGISIRVNGKQVQFSYNRLDHAKAKLAELRP